MKLTNFSFKSEPIWMLLLSLTPVLVGLLILVLVLLLRQFKLV